MSERELQLIARLRSRTEVEREEAARTIRDEWCNEAVIEALGHAALSDPNPTVRYFAVQSRQLEIDVLAAVLDQDHVQSVRREAAGRLFSRARESVLAERALVAALHDADYEVRAKPLYALEDNTEVI